MPQLTLEQIVSRTGDLPALPEATLSVMRETDKAEATARSVAQHIIKDQSLAARVLRLANSAFYGLPRQVNQIEEAVVILGMRTVKNLAMIASSYAWFAKELKGYGLGPQDMWRHSLATATAAQVIAEHTRKAPGDLAFCCGLLHDLGKLALHVWLDGSVDKVIQIAIQTGKPFDEIERAAFGFDHADVGAHLAAGWNLPESYKLSMNYHHRPDECPTPDPVVDMVHLGDYLAMSMGLGLGADGMVYALSEGALERLGLNESSLEELASKFLDAWEKSSSMTKELAA